MQSVPIDQFLTLARAHPILDVRSPSEYGHAHIPGAHSLPLFSDDERKVVGTAYMQQSREDAIKIGLDYFGVKMRALVEMVEAIAGSLPRTVLVHCWRGGMRSAGVAWLLDLYGFKVYTLVGGYKAYRNWSLQQFSLPWQFNVIGGYTGSGKTELLYALSQQGHATIDLEAIAHHKGSAFGGLGQPAQPTQEMFENILALQLSKINSSPVYIEDESRRIGQLNIPNALWETMQRSPVSFLDIPFSERLAFIAEAYGKFTTEELTAAITRIQKRLGGLNAKTAIAYLNEGNLREAFGILLTYYDKCYYSGLHIRPDINALLSTYVCTQIDAVINAQNLLAKKHL